MPNQVLEFHRVSPRCFDLSGIRTGSIRDQLLRSSAVVNALDEEGLIGRGRPLLVCGAGPAGINAAILASRRGVKVVVLEREKQPFQTLDGSFRRVDPTEYDWPHTHFKEGHFPARAHTVPSHDIGLRQASGYASLLVTAWKHIWRRSLQSSQNSQDLGRVDFLPGVDASGITCRDPGAGHYVDVTGYWTPQRNKLELKPFGAVLSCVGHGEERISQVSPPANSTDYVGTSFWKDNDGIWPDTSLPAGISNVVVSGGGDGAMQDIQRVLTSHSGKQLYARLEQTPLAPDAELRWRLLSAEEGARRECSWASSRKGEAEAFRRWNEVYASLIETQFDQVNPYWVASTADQLFRGAGRETQPRLWWVYDKPCPGHVYALNRYLVLFLIRLAKEANGEESPIKVLSNSRISSIVGEPGHACGKPLDCLGKKHEVLVTGEHPDTLENIHLIILRHGIDPSNAILNQRLSLPEQLSPFDLPPF
jgi:hypothetical protein